MDIKKQFNVAVSLSISAGLLIFAGGQTEIVLRFCIVAISGIAFYKWIKYFKSYIDFKIDSLKDSPGKKNS